MGIRRRFFSSLGRVDITLVVISVPSYLTKEERMFSYAKRYSSLVIALIIGFVIGTAAVVMTYHPAPKIVEHVIEKPVPVPVYSGTKIIKVPVHLTVHDKSQITCLAEAAYFEARNQSDKGKTAVANVVMNRTHSHKFPKTACSVVYQRSQFSWAESKPAIIEHAQFTRALKIATNVYLNNLTDVTHGALYFHAKYVEGMDRKQTASIGDHIFYR
jgi:hypothetical protein